MNEKHPAWYVLPAMLAIAGGIAFWSATGRSLESPLFWKAASLLLFLTIAGLAANLLRNVSLLYSRIKRQVRG